MPKGREGYLDKIGKYRTIFFGKVRQLDGLFFKIKVDEVLTPQLVYYNYNFDLLVG